MKNSIWVFCLLLLSCNAPKPNEGVVSTNEKSKLSSREVNELNVIGAMRNVMWQGELAAKLRLDSLIEEGNHLYGIGPLEGLQGELLVWDDTVYVSKFLSHDSMQVFIDSQAGAPFFVATQNPRWELLDGPDSIRSIKDLEQFLYAEFDTSARFAFQIEARVEYAEIHLQDLAPGTKVRSPRQAHAGQKNYILKDRDVRLLGFYSTSDQGVFTHHDSFLHLHLISQDQRWMGHLDSVRFKNLELKIALSH